MRPATATGMLAAGAVLLAACGGVTGTSVQPGPAPAAPVLRAPLQASFAAGGSTYAVVAMGHLDQPANTFWQLVARLPGSPRWTLVTPPGVADNGGLVVAASGHHLTAAFLPSGGLRFSPLAVTADGGGNWSAAGLVAGALAAAPDALAARSASSGLALEAGGAGVLAGGAGGSWTPWVTGGNVGASTAGHACDVQGLTAVALDSTGRRLLGATCAQPVAGIFEALSGGGWALARLPLPAALAAGPVTVLRLVTGSIRAPAAVAALLAGGGTDPWVAACWAASAAGPWRRSPALPIGSGASLVSTGFGPAGEAVVLWQDRSGRLHAAADAGPAGGWTVLADPPSGSEVVVAGATGSLDVLSVGTTVLTDWHLDARHERWTRGPQLVVPIAFGSSG